MLRGRQAERPKAPPVPDTDTTRLLGAIDVRPAQQIELASMPSAAIEAAIADGRARGGIRDLAGWVVYLLRQRRDHGWTLPPLAPCADAPEVLAAYFRERAAEQEREPEVEQADEHSSAERLTEVFSAPTLPAPPAKLEQQPSLTELWQDTLAGLRLRLPRDVYQTCVHQATLISYADNVATVGVSDRRTKDTLERCYPSALRSALSDALGYALTMRVVINQPMTHM